MTAITGDNTTCLFVTVLLNKCFCETVNVLSIEILLAYSHMTFPLLLPYLTLIQSHLMLPNIS